MTDKAKLLEKIASERILILDGAMGTMIQRHGLTEADYRGKEYADWPSDLKGNNDLLSITKPEVIEGIHAAFLEAGADIIETNTFSSTAIPLADYGMSHLARDYNLASARLARKVADTFTAKTPKKPRFVAGAVGPMNKSLSMSPDVNNPGFREVEFDEVAAAYKEQVEALIDGGVDIILIETVFDTLNAKAAIFAAEEVFEERGTKLPIILSSTVTDRSGRNLSGQTIEAFWYSVKHARPFAVGLNCAFGADLMRPYAVALNRVAGTRVSIYPNAGLPNELGEYDETPAMTAEQLEGWAKEGLFNIVGGCCGTTPDHIRAIANAVKAYAPRKIPTLEPEMRLSGLDPLTIIGQSAA